MADRFAPTDPQGGFLNALSALLSPSRQPGASSAQTMPAKAGMAMDGETMRNALEMLVSGLQGASNGAAQAVTVPVDSIAELLRAAGVPINQPIGGDEWMRAHGLLAEPRNALAGAVGEGLGLAASGALLRLPKAR